MRSVGAFAIAILLVACMPVVGPAGGGAPALGGAAAPGDPAPFPECQTDQYAFAGVSTLSALGMNEFGPDSSKSGMIWITANPVAQPGMVPMGGVPPPPSRMVCVQWQDGSGMAGPVPDDWEMPQGVGVTVAGAGAEAGGVPLAMLALLAGAILLVGVSVVAFRRDASAA
jgi:hypothetical protein